MLNELSESPSFLKVECRQSKTGTIDAQVKFETQTGNSGAEPVTWAHLGYNLSLRTRLLPNAQSESWQNLNEMSAAFRAGNNRDSGQWTESFSDGEFNLRARLRAYEKLGDNWDRDGARCPSPQAVQDALDFLDRRPSDIPLPYPEVGRDGDVGVFWDFKDSRVFAEVSFEGDRTLAYFAAFGAPNETEEECGEEDLSVDNLWPDDMLRILRLRNPI